MLTVATWNIGLARLTVLGIPLVDAVPHAGVRMRPVVEAIGAHRETVDIWLLQEAYGPQIRRILRQVGGYRAILGPGWMRDRGLAILIREGWRCSAPEYRLFPANDWIEIVVAAKGVLVSDVMTPMGPLRIGTLHTSYDGRGRASIARKAPHSRRRQIGIAMDLLESRSDAPILLGGDFNASLQEEPETHAVITGRGWRDLALTADHRLGPDITTWSNTNALASPGHPDNDIDLICGHGIPDAWRVETGIFMHEPVLTMPDGSALPLSDHNGLKITLSG